MLNYTDIVNASASTTMTDFEKFQVFSKATVPVLVILWSIMLFVTIFIGLVTKVRTGKYSQSRLLFRNNYLATIFLVYGVIGITFIILAQYFPIIQYTIYNWWIALWG